MSVGPRTEKFDIIGNDHAGFLQSLREFGARKYFTYHHTPNTIQGFGNSVLVCKMQTVTVGYAKIELRIWSFQGYQRNTLWIFQGLIKNEV